ncbi:MAG: hypothetical protein U0271_39940 [Polyangiaceae bacterium]
MRTVPVLVFALVVAACGDQSNTKASADSSKASSSAKSSAKPPQSSGAKTTPTPSATPSPTPSAASQAPSAAPPAASETAAADVPVGEATPFEFDPKGLKISLPIKKDKWEELTIKDDGGIYAKETLLGKVTPKELHDETDKVIVTLAENGQLAAPGEKDSIFFNDKDELILPKEGKVIMEGDFARAIKLDGTVHDPDGSPKIEGATDKNKKRTGILIAMVFGEKASKIFEKEEEKK